MTKFWEIVRNIGALIALVWVGLQIYNYVNQKGYKLDATVDTNKFVLPKDFYNLVAYDSKENILNLMNQKFGKSEDKTIRNFIDSFLSKSSILDFQYPFNFENCSQINLRNSGDKEVKDIQLITNQQKIIYQFVNSDGKSFFGTSDNKVELGKLLPSEKIEVFIWHGYNYQEDFSISFPEGNAKIKQAKKLYGLAASLGEFFSDWTALIVLVFIVFLIFQTGTLIYKIGEKNGENKVSKVDDNQGSQTPIETDPNKAATNNKASSGAKRQR